MNRHWAVSVCIAGLLLVAYAEEPDVDIPTECPKEDSPDKVVMIAHEYDCTKFYMCHGGGKILNKCGPMDNLGNLLYFNPRTQTCDWPSSSGCKNGQVSTDASTKEDFTQASSELPTTMTETATEGTTAPSTELPGTTEILTEEPSTEGVTDSTTDAVPTDTSTDGLVPDPPSTEDVSGATEGTTDEPSTVHPEDSASCPSDGSMNGAFYPHKSSCRKYYICFDSWLHLHECEGGQHFNPQYDKCDKPEHVGCSEATTTTVSTTTEPTTTESTTTEPTTAQSTTTEPTTTESTTTEPTTTTESTTTETPSTISEIIPTKCPKGDSVTPIRIPHPTNCGLYSECVKGGKVLKRCARGSHFNPKLQMCDWPEKAGCSPKPSKCPENRLILIPHETEGTLYYECHNGEKELKKCLDGLEFDPNSAICDWPPARSSKTVKSVAMLNRKGLYKVVKSRDQEFNNFQNEGTVVDNDRCIGTCDLEDGEKVIHLRHVECTKFCKCSFGTPYVFVCPHRLHYNQKKEICDYPYQAGCKAQRGRLWV